MGLDTYQIRDMHVYVERMQKSILDKMFFIDKVFEPFTTIVDFGCANGELIKTLQFLFGEHRYIGYDISEEMLCAARKNVPDAAFFSDWDAIDADFSQSLVNLSSTLHEIYSYNTPEDIEAFWDKIFNSGFQYITIRDMMLSETAQTTADADQLHAVTADTVYADKLRDYEQTWGTIRTQHDLVHYLLKYKYTENWEREVRENYLGISLEQLLARIPDTYEIAYMDHFTLPYTAWQIRQDFRITLTTPTHIKLILRRKEPLR